MNPTIRYITPIGFTALPKSLYNNIKAVYEPQNTELVIDSELVTEANISPFMTPFNAMMALFDAYKDVESFSTNKIIICGPGLSESEKTQIGNEAKFSALFVWFMEPDGKFLAYNDEGELVDVYKALWD